MLHAGRRIVADVFSFQSELKDAMETRKFPVYRRPLYRFFIPLQRLGSPIIATINYGSSKEAMQRATGTPRLRNQGTGLPKHQDPKRDIPRNIANRIFSNCLWPNQRTRGPQRRICASGRETQPLIGVRTGHVPQPRL
jgi:hypothetical protein